MKARTINGLILGCLLLLISGCGGVKAYRAELPVNLLVNTRAVDVKVALDIYTLDTQCKTLYEGTVALTDKPVELGIAVGTPAYLVVKFSSSSFWRSSSSSISSDMVLHPRRGYRYVLDARYIDDIYNVNYQEVNRKTGNRRELEPVGLAACRKQ